MCLCVCFTLANKRTRILFACCCVSTESSVRVRASYYPHVYACVPLYMSFYVIRAQYFGILASLACTWIQNTQTHHHAYNCRLMLPLCLCACICFFRNVYGMQYNRHLCFGIQLCISVEFRTLNKEYRRRRHRRRCCCRCRSVGRCLVLSFDQFVYT